MARKKRIGNKRVPLGRLVDTPQRVPLSEYDRSMGAPQPHMTTQVNPLTSLTTNRATDQDDPWVEAYGDIGRAMPGHGMSLNRAQETLHRTGWSAPPMDVLANPVREIAGMASSRSRQDWWNNSHRNCRLHIGHVARLYESLREARPEVHELWWVKNGLMQEALDWAIKRTNEGSSIVEESLPRRVGILILTERPFGRSNAMFAHNKGIILWHLCPGKGDSLRHEHMMLNSREGIGLHDIHLRDEYGKALGMGAWCFAAMRAYAMLPIVDRPKVDIDVAMPTVHRTAKKLPPPKIMVVRWRRPVTKMADPDHVATSRHVEWSHRWISRAHFRQLKNGRIIPVRESIKGPKDKPLILKTRVDALVK